MTFVSVVMKKIIITLLAVFYLGISSGATVHFHYCMGQLTEWGFGAKEKPAKCGKCGMQSTDSKSCCKHENKQPKVDKVQKISDNSVQLKDSATAVLLFSSLFLTTEPVSSLAVRYPVSKAPPGATTTPAFIRNCNFRI